MIRARGNLDNRRYWVIDTNEACQLYIGTYSRIESIDRLIKTFRMKYMCWNYWHSPILRSMSIAVVVAYYMYLYLTEVESEQTWKDEIFLTSGYFVIYFSIR